MLDGEMVYQIFFFSPNSYGREIAERWMHAEEMDTESQEGVAIFYAKSNESLI